MPWHPTVVDSQILAIHVALVPSGDQGEVLLFGGDEWIGISNAISLAHGPVAHGA